MLNIGQAAKASGVSAKMIRHYEAIGLIPDSRRSQAGYRLYQAQDLHTLRFIKRARSMGFSLDRIRQLLSLWQDQTRASADVKDLALAHVAELDARIREMTEMRDVLLRLVGACQGDQRPDCPILCGLAE
ncbi:MAG: Cu(I)-responsive transcriptional regulator [Gammaproteobacteria bacterium]|nr:Cu(I)-responsive transcriptional regulator [Gammaproteobacteria bacterium]